MNVLVSQNTSDLGTRGIDLHIYPRAGASSLEVAGLKAQLDPHGLAHLLEETLIPRQVVSGMLPLRSP